MFTARKVAQMAAVIAKTQGGTINVLKLVKLLYLADREALGRYGFPISFDNVVAMPHGPVLSKTLDLINGFVDGPTGAQWDEWIGDREDHNVTSRRDFSRADLDELSDADLEVISDVIAQFGKWDQWTLRDYTHGLKEWRDPNGSRAAIPDEEILIALGRDAKEAAALAHEIQTQREFDRILSSL